MKHLIVAISQAICLRRRRPGDELRLKPQLVEEHYVSRTVKTRAFKFSLLKRRTGR